MGSIPPALYGAFVVLGLAVLGASAGVVTLVNQAGEITTAELGALFFGAIFLASAMGMQMYRRDLAGSTLVGGLAGALGVLAFFAAPFFALSAWGGYEPPSPRVLGTFLLVAPLVAFGMSAAGTLLLAGGVQRYRARHGMTHAPK